MNSINFFTAICAFSFITLSNIQAQTVSTNTKSNKEMKRTGSQTFICGDDTPWENAGEGITRQILGYDGQLMMVKVKFEKGAIGTLHSHYQSQCTYVASGKFEFTINGETKIVKEGDCLFKTPDLVHGCVCIEPGVLIDTFSPMRQDFLKK